MGPGADVEAQDAMARLTLDVVLMAGFGIASNTIGDPKPVPLLTELHYAMDESFRFVFLPCPLTSFCNGIHPSLRVGEKEKIYIDDIKGGIKLCEKLACGCGGCRTFSEPVRAVLLKLLPFLPAAKEREAHFARLYGIWDGWIQQMLARGPPPESDDSMWACITRVRDPSTGLFAHSSAAPEHQHAVMLQPMAIKRAHAQVQKAESRAYGCAVVLAGWGWSSRGLGAAVGRPMEGDRLQAEVASLIVGGLDTTAQTCSFTL